MYRLRQLTQPLTHPPPTAPKKLHKIRYQAKYHILHTWSSPQSSSCRPKYRSNIPCQQKSALWQPTFRRNESILKSIGRANFVLQRQAKKNPVRRSIAEDGASCFMHKKPLNLRLPFALQFESSWEENPRYDYFPCNVTNPSYFVRKAVIGLM